MNQVSAWLEVLPNTTEHWGLDVRASTLDNLFGLVFTSIENGAV